MTTIKDVARHANLGLATVSRYINGGNVRERNKLAIESAIKELNFEVNDFARGLRSKKSLTIGVVIPEISDIFMTTILSYVSDILRTNGYSMIFSDCRSDDKREHEAIRFLLLKKVDGLITMPYNQSGSQLKPLIEKKIPIVLIDREIAKFDNSIHAVLVDNARASEEATQLLIDAGHRNIGLILGPEQVYTSRQRFLGYRQALTNSNIPLDMSYVQYTDFRVSSGYERTVHLLSQVKPSALFTTNYYLTLGAMMAISDMRLSVPNDIAIIGFDNMQASKVLKPQLTLIEQPFEEIAENAAEIMLSALSGELDKSEIRILPTSLHRGESI